MNIKKTLTISIASLAFAFLFAIPSAPAHAISIGNISFGSGGLSVSGCTTIGGVSIGGGSSSGGGSYFGIGSSPSACGNASGIGLLVLNLINNILVPLIFAVAFIVFIVGIFRYFIAGATDPEGQKKGRQLLLYGILGFVIMISLWGIVNIVSNTLGLGGAMHPQFPLI